MKYVGHLIAADLRRHPLLLAAGVLVAVASTLTAGLTSSLPLDPTSRAVAGLLEELCWIGSVVLIIITVAMMVQIHPLVGSDAFWMTRPIPPLSLLAAKLIVLSIVVVIVPALAEIGLMWAYGVPWGRMVQVSAEGLPFSVFLLVLLMSAAAITRSLPRYMLLLAGGVGCLAVAVGVLLAVMMSRLDDDVPLSGASRPDDPTGGMVTMALLVLAGLALLRNQYTSRSRLRAIAIGIGAACAAVLAGSYWPWPLLQPLEATPRWANQPSSARLEGMAGSLRSDTSSGFRSLKVWRTLSADVTLTGLEPGWSATIAPSRSSLEIAGHVVWSSESGMQGPVQTGTEPTGTEHAAFQSVLGVGRLFTPSRQPTRTSLLAMRDADFQRLGAGRATYRAEAQLRLTRNYVEAVLPLVRGSYFHAGAHDVLLQDVERSSIQVHIVIRDSEPHSVFERVPWSPTQYFLRSRTVNEAVYAAYAQPVDTSRFSLLQLVNMSPGGSSTAFPPRTYTVEFDRADRLGQPWQLDDRWVDSAELVIVRSAPEGSVTRALEITNLDVQNAPPSERD